MQSITKILSEKGSLNGFFTYANSLKEKEKGDLVFNQGKYLAVREYYGHLINLYLVEGNFACIPKEN
jgi:hypothetical protein